MAVLLEQASHTPTSYSCYYTDPYDGAAGPGYDRGVSWAQTFTIPYGVTWTISSVGMWLTETLTGAYTYTMQLLGTVGGVPDPTNVIATVGFSSAGITGSDYFKLAAPYGDFTAGTYALVLLYPVALMPGTEGVVNWGASTADEYADGGTYGYFHGDFFAPAPSAFDEWVEYPSATGDMSFIIEGTATAAPFTPPVGGPTKRRLVACANDKFWYEGI